MSGANDTVPRNARVAAFPTIRLPQSPGQQVIVPAGVAVAVVMPASKNGCVVPSVLAGTTLTFVTTRGALSCQVSPGPTPPRIELPNDLISMTVTSTAITILWVEDFREP